MKIIRIFPTQTNLTPDDEDVRINALPTLFDEADEVHISVLFSWDKPRAEFLAKQWSAAGFNVKLGGVAYSSPSNEFVIGKYVKKGAVITSRGCNNHCWFCNVWRKEKSLRELPVQEGYNLLDNNILACSEAHIREVFAMLKRQPQKAILTGGLEAKILKRWHAELLADLKPARMFFAYDTPDDREPFLEAMKLLDEVGISRWSRYCYCLCGYKGDTYDAAIKRLTDIWNANARPFAMLYRDEKGDRDDGWRRFCRQFTRPQITDAIFKKGATIIKGE